MLDASSVVEKYEVLDFKAFEDGWYYKIEVEMEDQSVLHAREYTDENQRTYAYHWQDEKNQLRIRWDNAPHHEHISTHPHHKHVGDDLRPSKEITLEEVLEFIEGQLHEENE